MIILTFFTTYEVFEFVLFKIIENTLHLFTELFQSIPKILPRRNPLQQKNYEAPYKEVIIYKK